MEARELEDSFLIRRISAGDQEAFARFFDPHSPAVRGLLLRTLGGGGGGEEVLQETFLQVWGQAARYQPSRSTARGWLLMLARSRALDRLRRPDARGRPAQDAAPAPSFPRPPAPPPTPPLPETKPPNPPPPA